MPKPADPDALTDHLEGVRRLVRTLVRSEADVDDVVQDTMVAALENRTRVRGGLRAWLGGVARNMVRRSARSEGRRANHEQAAATHGPMPATADVIARAAEQRRVLDALLGMEEPYRSAVLLRYVEDLPPRKIARRLEVPVETVRTHVKRGLQRLRDRLGEAHGGDRRELHAALALAASEPLGAAHARAVALARASGLVLLLGLSAGAILLFSHANRDAVQEEAPLTADAPSIHPPVASRSEAPVAQPPADPAPAPVVVPPARLAATAPSKAGGPEPGRTEPSAPPVEPPPDVPVVQPIKPAPPPRVAVENDGEKRGGKNGGGAAPQGEPAPADDPLDDGGEFYDGDTSFSGAQVNKAIEKGVTWLTRRQRTDGSWGAITFNSTYGGEQKTSEGMHAGPTALALYALLKCKVPKNHPAVVRGFDYLHKHFYKPPSSYETSMLLLAVTATADASKMSATSKRKKVKPRLKGRYRTWAVKLRDHLLKKREARGWRYNTKKGRIEAGGPEDLSSTQLAALALFSAHQLGVKVKHAVWEDILRFSLEQQSADGPEVVYTDPVDPTKKRTARARGFAYILGSEDEAERTPRGGMTACGLANLEMARFVLSAGGAERDAWNKREDAARVQEAIFDGLAWLDKNWSSFEDPHAKRKNVYHIYWLYAVERAMDLFGLKLVGSHRWYSEMGQELLNRQFANGSWETRKGAGGHDVLDTSFALLFLKRATKGPIAIPSVTGGNGDPSDNR